MKKKQQTESAFAWALPEKLKVPADPLRARLDFHNQACILTVYGEDCNETKIVSALDVAHALAKELSTGTGILPANTLWWQNTPEGPVQAIYEEPRIRKVALQTIALKAPKRYTIPLPGLIFLCSPGKPPWVFAVTERPQRENDKVYEAPLCNIFESGKSCPGNNKYPADVSKIVESFFISFFSEGADLRMRSQKYPDTIVKLWKFLDGKKKYPLEDLVQHGTIKDLMEMPMKGER